MIEHDADAVLLPRIAAGDQAAIRQLVAQKLPRLLALGVRMLNNRAEAEEVAQETFIRVWKNAGSWQAEGAKFDTWLHKVALNLCYDRLRLRHETSDDEMPEQIDMSPTPEEHVSQNQQGAQVAVALAQLPTKQREALVLQYYQALTNIETAKLMDVSVEAVESLLSRARRNLKTLLTAQGFKKGAL